MIKWVQVDTIKINKIGYNADIQTMYIDFSGSTTDTPYQGIKESIFTEFSQAEDVDYFFEARIENCFEQVTIDCENTVNLGSKF